MIAEQFLLWGVGIAHVSSSYTMLCLIACCCGGHETVHRYYW